MTRKPVTVGELKRFLENFDSDCEVHFIFDNEKIHPFERWSTDLGPMFSFKSHSEPVIAVRAGGSGIFTEPDGAA